MSPVIWWHLVTNHLVPLIWILFISCSLSVVVIQLLSCITLCNHMDCSTSRFPVLHYLPELAQTQVHSVGDAIQPSHPLLPSFPPAFSLSQHQGLFQWVGFSHLVAKVLKLQHQYQSFQWICRLILKTVLFLWFYVSSLKREGCSCIWPGEKHAPHGRCDSRIEGVLLELCVVYQGPCSIPAGVLWMGLRVHPSASGQLCWLGPPPQQSLLYTLWCQQKWPFCARMESVRVSAVQSHRLWAPTIWVWKPAQTPSSRDCGAELGGWACGGVCGGAATAVYSDPGGWHDPCSGSWAMAVAVSGSSYFSLGLTSVFPLRKAVTCGISASFIMAFLPSFSIIWPSFCIPFASLFSLLSLLRTPQCPARCQQGRWMVQGVS